jgi:putative nucleotidyltransferase with HDIG domain
MPELPLASWTDGTSINNIFNLSRQLVATNRLDVLLESIARHATEILQVKFSRIITLEPDGSISVQAYYIDPSLPIHQQDKLKILPPTPKIYRQAISSKTPLLVQRDDSLPIYWSRQELGLDVVDSLCLLPMRVDSEAIGVLILGDSWIFNREPFVENRMRMASLIAEQAAGAIYRVRLSNRLKDNQLQTVMALAKILEKRDGETGSHCENMADFAVMIATRMHCTHDEVQAIHWAAMLHDIGKIGWPDSILRKPAPLNDEEWVIVKQHPDKGAEIVLMVSNMEHVAFIIKAHHEYFDGSGYPLGLKKNRIPLGARILAVADAYITMTDGRCWRKAISHEEAITEIKRCSGTVFDPEVVEVILGSFDLSDFRPAPAGNF